MARDWWEDPACPALPDPPKVPSTGDLSCHTFWTGQWWRRTLFINSGAFPTWQSLALQVKLTTANHDVSDIWVRFQRTHPVTGALEGAPYDFYVTFMPKNTDMVIDGIRDLIQMTKGQDTVQASHLVYRSAEGHVFRWPVIDCGGTWQMIVRHPKKFDVNAVLVNASAAVKYA